MLEKLTMSKHKNVELHFARSEFRVEQRAEAKGKTIVGYAALYSTMLRTSMMREMIAPGAFDSVLEDDVRCLFNHDDNQVLGRTKSGTVRLSLDEKGLRYECDLPDTSTANDLVKLMERGDIGESSFAFNIAADGSSWSYPEDDVPLRTITKISRLYDVSPVTYPAYDTTSVALRSMDLSKPKDLEPKTDFLKLKIKLLKLL